MKKIPSFGLIVSLFFVLLCGCEKENVILPTVRNTGSMSSIEQNDDNNLSVLNSESFEKEETLDFSETSDMPSAEHKYKNSIPVKILVEIYEEKTEKLFSSFELKEENACADIFSEFHSCFNKACDEYPQYNTLPEEQRLRTQYRIVVYLQSYSNESKDEITCINLSYPYNHSNDIYSIFYGYAFTDYYICGGAPFIELIDTYVDKYISQE